MKRLAVKYYALVALSFAGSAILLFSCQGAQSEQDAAADEALMTEFSEDLSIVESENGRRSFHFETPLVEGYLLAKEPYREFRKGIKITTFNNDSLSSVDAVLTANYAIFYTNRKLWEAKGNVVAQKSDGKTLYTQQLFWDQRTKRIYSNVDSKIVQSGGRDVFIGEGFESDEAFKDWRFRRMKGRMEVDVAPTESPDSTAAAAKPTPPTTEKPTQTVTAKPVPISPAVKTAPRAAARKPEPEGPLLERPAGRGEAALRPEDGSGRVKSESQESR